MTGGKLWLLQGEILFLGGSVIKTFRDAEILAEDMQYSC
jgi:hypothetical protein